MKSPWNFGASYQLNDYVNLSAQYLYGSQVSVTAHVSVNPGRPPIQGGKELAPVPMRLRVQGAPSKMINNETIIRKVLTVDGFEIQNLNFKMTLSALLLKIQNFDQRHRLWVAWPAHCKDLHQMMFNLPIFPFYSKDLQTATYRVDLEKITLEQFDPRDHQSNSPSITAIDINCPKIENEANSVSLGCWALCYSPPL